MTEMVKLLDDIYDDGYEFESDYIYKGRVVPRVTKILSRCIHNDGLMYWANSLGFKHKSYKRTLNEAADIGSECHNAIDEFLDCRDKNEPFKEPVLSYNARNAFRAFLKWFLGVSESADVEVTTRISRKEPIWLLVAPIFPR